MRYIRYLFLATFAVGLVTLSMANRGMVTLNLLPAELSGFLGFSWSITLPLFLVILLGIILGRRLGLSGNICGNISTALLAIAPARNAMR